MRFEFWFKEDDIAYSEFFDKFPVDDGLIVIDHEDSEKVWDHVVDMGVFS